MKVEAKVIETETNNLGHVEVKHETAEQLIVSVTVAIKDSEDGRWYVTYNEKAGEQRQICWFDSSIVGAHITDKQGNPIVGSSGQPLLANRPARVTIFHIVRSED